MLSFGKCDQFFKASLVFLQSVNQKAYLVNVMSFSRSHNDHIKRAYCINNIKPCISSRTLKYEYQVHSDFVAFK
jgi:hypothetical protein